MEDEHKETAACLRGGPVMTPPRPDDLDLAIRSGAIAALRKRAHAIRKRAADGITVVDGPPMTIIKTSEAAHAFKIAADLDQIANALDGGAS
jgi:hypothetical protein